MKNVMCHPLYYRKDGDVCIISLFVWWSLVILMYTHIHRKPSEIYMWPHNNINTGPDLLFILHRPDLRKPVDTPDYTRRTYPSNSIMKLDLKYTPREISCFSNLFKIHREKSISLLIYHVPFDLTFGIHFIQKREPTFSWHIQGIHYVE